MSLFSRIAALFGGRKLDRELDDEIAAHIEMRTQRNLDAGMLPEEARRQALRLFGNRALVKEDARSFSAAVWLETLLQDVRYGCRLVRRNPLLSAAVVLTLSIGIGLNTGVFTVLNGLVLQPHVASDPSSFVQVAPQYLDRAGRPQGQQGWLSASDLESYASDTHQLSALAGYWIHSTFLGDDGRRQLSLGVTCNYFSVYPVHMRLGRTFATEECTHRGKSPVVVLSEELWRERFGADEQIVGKTIRLDRIPLTIIGVVAADYDGRTRGRGIWFPYTMEPVLNSDANLFADENAHWLVAVGRLRAGASRAAAQAELAILAAQRDRLQPGRTTVMHVTNGAEIEDPAGNPGLIWLVVLLIMGTLSLVLVLSCANVATLLLSRAAARQQEIAIRISLGAAPARLVRMLMVETLLLAAAAGSVSVYLAYAIPVLFKRHFTVEPFIPLAPDLTVFAYLAIVTLVVGCVAGASPATEALRQDLTIRLKGEDTFLRGGAHSRWNSRDVLVALQVAASLVLLVGGALFARAQYVLFTTDAGYETRHVLLATLPIRLSPDATAQFHAELQRRVAALPGVQSVAFTGQNSWTGDSRATEELRLPGQPADKGQPIASAGVSPDYFRTLDVPILRGRAFSAADAPGARFAIVSRKMALSYWPKQDPIGKQIVDSRGTAYEVVGVAADVKAGILDDPNDMQAYFLRDPRAHGSSLVVRFSGDAKELSKAIAGTMHDMDPDMVIVPQTIQSILDDESDHFWNLAKLVIDLGIAAILLAVVGIYGVVAFSVKRRTKEFGIRIALGATAGNILALVLRSSAGSLAVGLGAGLAAASLAAWGLSETFRGTPLAHIGFDPLTFAAVAILLGFTAIVAMLGPARSAAKTDPMVALRHQ